MTILSTAGLNQYLLMENLKMLTSSISLTRMLLRRLSLLNSRNIKVKLSTSQQTLEGLSQITLRHKRLMTWVGIETRICNTLTKSDTQGTRWNRFLDGLRLRKSSRKYMLIKSRIWILMTFLAKLIRASLWICLRCSKELTCLHTARRNGTWTEVTPQFGKKILSWLTNTWNQKLKYSLLTTFSRPLVLKLASKRNNMRCWACLLILTCWTSLQCKTFMTACASLTLLWTTWIQ